MALVIAPSSSEALDVRLVGGKASSLAFLSQIEGVRVPPFFSVSARAFKASVSVSPDVLALVQELQPLEEYRDIEVVSKRLRETIKKIPLPAQLEADIAASYETLCKQMGRANVAVAVRSSATLEDLKDASFAGQHSTKLNIVGIADVLSSVRKCWASAFNARACEYRNKHKLPHSDVLMAVAVQVMIRPYAAGTGFSVELGTAFPGLHVASTYGVGEGLVSGDVTGDEFLFQRGSLMLIKRTLGSKTTQYVFNEQVSGIKLETVDAELAKSYSLPVETARSVARSVEKIEQVYRDKFNYRYIDTEFGVTKDGDVFTVYFLQARPVVEVHADKVVQTVDNTAGTGDVICEGRYGLMGAVYGRVHVVQRFEDLSEGKTRIDPDDILVTLKTGNAWTQYLKTLKALVTAEGSASSHPMLIGRERGIPVVVGVPDAIALLQPFNGDWVTLDGLKRKVFSGKQKLRDCTAEDLRSMFEVVPVMKMQSDEESKKVILSTLMSFLITHIFGFLVPS
jgi:pyruvate,water dikinase